MDCNYTIHFPGVLSGKLFIISHLVILVDEYIMACTQKYVLALNLSVLILSDSSLWHHVIRLCRPFLLDESNSSLQQR